MKNRLTLNIFSVLHIAIIFNVGAALIVGILVKSFSPLAWVVTIGILNVATAFVLGFVYKANNEKRTFIKSIVISFFAMQTFYLILYLMRFPGYLGRGFLFIPALDYSGGFGGLLLSKLEVLLGFLFVPLLAEIIKSLDFKFRFKRRVIVLSYFELILFYEFVLGLAAGYLIPNYEVNGLFIALLSVPIYFYYRHRSRNANVDTKVQLTLAAVVSYLPLLIGVIYGMALVNREVFSVVINKKSAVDGFSPLLYMRVLGYISLFASILVRFLMIYHEEFKKSAIYRFLKKLAEPL